VNVLQKLFIQGLHLLLRIMFGSEAIGFGYTAVMYGNKDIGKEDGLE
jgi:hypothetical protein